MLKINFLLVIAALCYIAGAAITTVGEKKRCNVFTRTPGIELAECAVKCKELSSTAFGYGSTDKMCACYTEKYVDGNCLREVSPSMDLYKITAVTPGYELVQVRTRCEVWKDFTSPTADACAAQCGGSAFFAFGRQGTAKCVGAGVGAKCSCVCYTKTAQDCPVEDSDTLDLYKITV
jgi:hypothetical protein